MTVFGQNCSLPGGEIPRGISDGIVQPLALFQTKNT